ncbi:hypothetical protein AHAS_Ahas20G0109800 [Arachis hypogaea]
MFSLQANCNHVRGETAASPGASSKLKKGFCRENKLRWWNRVIHLLHQLQEFRRT